MQRTSARPRETSYSGWDSFKVEDRLKLGLLGDTMLTPGRGSTPGYASTESAGCGMVSSVEVIYPVGPVEVDVSS